MGLILRRESIPSPITEENTNTDISSYTPADPWLAVIIVISVLIISTLGVFLLVHRIKSRQEVTRATTRPRSATSSMYSLSQFSRSARRHKAEEQERITMIEKSLASRTSLVSVPYDSRKSSIEDGEKREMLDNDDETTGLKEDWKHWEAQIQDERRCSTPGGVGLDQHPALASLRPAIPPPLRLPSPHRYILPPRTDYTPPPYI